MIGIYLSFHLFVRHQSGNTLCCQWFFFETSIFHYEIQRLYNKMNNKTTTTTTPFPFQVHQTLGASRPYIHCRKFRSLYLGLGINISCHILCLQTQFSPLPPQQKNYRLKHFSCAYILIPFMNRVRYCFPEYNFSSFVSVLKSFPLKRNYVFKVMSNVMHSGSSIGDFKCLWSDERMFPIRMIAWPWNEPPQFSPRKSIATSLMFLKNIFESRFFTRKLQVVISHSILSVRFGLSLIMGPNTTWGLVI